VTGTAGANGSIDPTSAVVDYGANQDFNATPDTGYEVDKWSVDGGEVQTGSTTYSLSTITANHTVAVSFKILTYTVSASAGANGSIDPSGDITKDYGSSQLFTVTPTTGYEVDKWTVDSVDVQTGGTTYTLGTITANHTVAVSFKIMTYTVTASVGANGSIDPIGAVVVNYGKDQLFTATPDVGYEVTEWFVDGESVQTGGTTYELINVTAAHTVHVRFTGSQHEISGTITCAGLPVANVNMGGLGVITDVNGFYSTTVSPDWSGVVTPAKSGYVFDPNSRSYANVNSDQTDQNYLALDLEIFCANWLNAGEGDFNKDGIVNFFDFAEFGLAW
jgi:uncharacterized protein YaaQ